MTTSSVVLRPLGTGEILDRAARLYRRHFVTFIAIIAAVEIPTALIQLGASAMNIRLASDLSASQEPSLRSLLPSLIGLLVSLLSAVLIQTLGTGAMTRAVADSYLGEPVSFAGSYRKIGKRWGTLIVAMVLVVLLTIGLFIWWIVPCIGWVTGLGMLMYTSMVITPLVAPVVVLEQSPARSSLRRTWDLSRRRFWPVVGFMVALAILGFVFTLIPQVIIAAVGLTNLDSLAQSSSGFTTATILSSLIGVAIALLYLPFRLAATTLMYFDLRVRTEAFDLDLLAHNTGPVPGSAAEASVSDALTAPVDQLLTPALDEPAQPVEGALTLEPVSPPAAPTPNPLSSPRPATAKTKLVTGEELAYFLLLTIVVAVGYMALAAIVGGLGALIGGAF